MSQRPFAKRGTSSQTLGRRRLPRSRLVGWQRLSIRTLACLALAA